jgi:hypothetical protein
MNKPALTAMSVKQNLIMALSLRQRGDDYFAKACAKIAKALPPDEHGQRVHIDPATVTDERLALYIQAHREAEANALKVDYEPDSLIYHLNGSGKRSAGKGSVPER